MIGDRDNIRTSVDLPEQLRLLTGKWDGAATAEPVQNNPVKNPVTRVLLTRHPAKSIAEPLDSHPLAGSEFLIHLRADGFDQFYHYVFPGVYGVVYGAEFVVLDLEYIMGLFGNFEEGPLGEQARG